MSYYASNYNGGGETIIAPQDKTKSIPTKKHASLTKKYI